jgi:hypothetical protein
MGGTVWLCSCVAARLGILFDHVTGVNGPHKMCGTLIVYRTGICTAHNLHLTNFRLLSTTTTSSILVGTD